ncbi:DUF6128 domain-containing protein [[Ruminococcus] gnavus]|uniref:DUF6128 domain-containing protein n=1 Tax=Mediterraneibacter gnavus TaxID=33038 RepID=A0A9X3HJN4_MEDGN|nr:DUF6128 domain-containing protein [Mediterraneibacter gnavus]MCQ4701293.1 DUF6128 domain-containing protein [Mediterraneibacter gnavus]MCZ7694325.1 DUF6128 domain-containing protein [Mediterraneibacter gnavus]MDB8707414.1 DUF6128 domain-containing protein [Mediterraneibacter gnavus]
MNTLEERQDLRYYMTPGIYYFYEYQADKKIRNVGFLKLTQTFQSCHLQISIRQIPAASQEKLPLSMFFFEKDKPRKKTVAELPTQNQCVSCRVTLSEADFPPNLTLAKLHGFLLQTADGRYFAASTGNRPFSVNLLTDWMEPAPCPEPNPEPESIPAPEPEPPSVLAEEKMCEPPEETAHPCEPTSRIRKLSYEDLSSLQKPFWRLANNSFLLHGYHNYHHLLLLEEDEHQWLGVPGIYSPREAHAAELFGFPQFTREYHQKLTLSEDECSTDKDFGYWCRCLK